MNGKFSRFTPHIQYFTLGLRQFIKCGRRIEMNGIISVWWTSWMNELLWNYGNDGSLAIYLAWIILLRNIELNISRHEKMNMAGRCFNRWFLILWLKLVLFCFFECWKRKSETAEIRRRLTRLREALEPGYYARCWAGREATTTSVRPTGRRRRRPLPVLRTAQRRARTTAYYLVLFQSIQSTYSFAYTNHQTQSSKYISMQRLLENFQTCNLMNQLSFCSNSFFAFCFVCTIKIGKRNQQFRSVPACVRDEKHRSCNI